MPKNSPIATDTTNARTIEYGRHDQLERAEPELPDPDADGHADEPAEHGQQHRLQQELADDVGALRRRPPCGCRSPGSVR